MAVVKVPFSKEFLRDHSITEANASLLANTGMDEHYLTSLKASDHKRFELFTQNAPAIKLLSDNNMKYTNLKTIPVRLLQTILSFPENMVSLRKNGIKLSTTLAALHPGAAYFILQYAETFLALEKHGLTTQFIDECYDNKALQPLLDIAKYPIEAIAYLQKNNNIQDFWKLTPKARRTELKAMALVNAGIIPEDYTSFKPAAIRALYIYYTHAQEGKYGDFSAKEAVALTCSNPEIVFRLAKRGVPFNTMQYFVDHGVPLTQLHILVHPTLSPEDKEKGGQSLFYIARYPQKACEHGIEALAKLPPSEVLLTLCHERLATVIKDDAFKPALESWCSMGRTVDELIFMADQRKSPIAGAQEIKGILNAQVQLAAILETALQKQGKLSPKTSFDPTLFTPEVHDLLLKHIKSVEIFQTCKQKATVFQLVNLWHKDAERLHYIFENPNAVADLLDGGLTFQDICAPNNGFNTFKAVVHLPILDNPFSVNGSDSASASATASTAELIAPQVDEVADHWRSLVQSQRLTPPPRYSVAIQSLK